VSAADFAEITAQTPGVDIGRIEVLPLFHPDLGSAPAEGVVTVLVIPRNDPAQPDAPEPDRLFLDTVCRYLDPRRVVTTEVHVRGPDYVKVWVSIGFEVVPGRDLAPVREAVKAAIRAFLSPLTGGFDGAGWPLQKSVEKLELWAVATRVDGVSKVTDVLLGDEAGDAKDRVPMAGLELPWLIGLSVQSGEPQELAELRGDTKTGDTTAAPTVVAIPVIPPEC
jgi:predicted phage baseplate assembly protein